MGNKETGLQDVLRVKMEILELQNKLALLTDQRKTTEIAFNSLLSRDKNISVVIKDSLEIESLPAEKLAIADSILANNPMLAMLESEISSYEVMEQKAKKMGLPMVGVGLNYMINQKRVGNTFMMNGDDMVMPMFSVSIPIYRKKYDAMQKEAQLMQQAGKQQTISLQNNLQVQYRSFIQNLDDAERRVILYNEQEELARKTTDLLLAGFATTGTDYEEVLRMQYKVLDYGFKRVEAITDYNTSVALAEKLMNSASIK
jgi:outer membrane protein TolC